MDVHMINLLIGRLRELYPDADCTLDFDSPWKLLVNTCLAAQCTDVRVNFVAPALYSAYPDLDALADCDIMELENIIRPCGFYHIKALHIKGMAQILQKDFNGVVPNDLKSLLTLPGVGQKTANLVLGEVYNVPGIVADTHCIRLSFRLGLTDKKDPGKVEEALSVLIPPGEQLLFCHRLVFHGRTVCLARSPRCGECTLSDLCAKRI